MTVTAMGVDSLKGDVDVEWLRASYEAFVQRRLERGALSIRTHQGYERLREKYQQRLRFVQDPARGDGDTTANGALHAAEKVVRGGDEAACEEAEVKTEYERYSDEEDEEEETTPPVVVVEPVVEAEDAPQAIESAHSEPDSEVGALKQLVGVFFDPRVKRLVLETIWPLAHRGGTPDDSNKGDTATKRASVVLPAVPEWQELEQHKYYALMFKTLLWLFPGLPAFEAQEHAERDWVKDCEFDAYGSYGLSFEGFMVSLLDLALACTDGTVEKCIEFLTHMTKRLEMCLPVFRVPTTALLPSTTDEDDTTDESRCNPYEQILWRAVPLMQLFPCPVHVQSQYLELKTKLSSAPIVLMVLASNERPLELQLSTSAKLLVRERDHRSSIRRNTMHSGALSHFIEIEKQFLWTFRSFPGRPTLIIVPSALVSKRTLALYACCRLLASHEHSLQTSDEHDTNIDPLLTFFTAVPEPFPLLYGSENSLCGRIDRHSSKLLVIDHRGRASKQFKIIFKTSLIHNTSAAGGSGAAAVVAALSNVTSTGTAHCTSELVGGNNQTKAQATAHSFIFVVKMTSDVLANGPQKRRASTVGAGKGTTKSADASVPAQWFTTFCGANENKTIFIDTEGDGDTETNPGGEDSTGGVYYVYVFTLHGFYFEATYEDNDPAADSPPTSSEDSAMAVLTNQKERDHSPGSVLPPSGENQSELMEDWMHLGGNQSDKKAVLQNVTNSASLLRQLLLLRKKRQGSTQPPPECIGGSKITSVKAATAAAGLRAKFLRARDVERRTRFLQNEEALRLKVLAKLMKTEAKKRALKGDFDPSDPDQETAVGTDPQAVGADFGAKAALLSNFFKEIAVYQPSQREIDQAGTEEDGHAPEADELLEHFADLFEDDHALHNMLDAEKWLTVEAKVTRRKSILEARVQKRRQSLVELGKEQVPELGEHFAPTGDADADGKAKLKDRKKSTGTQRASEDYFSTAMLIRDLMREVAEEGEQTAKKATPDSTAESDVLKQLTASYHFAAGYVHQQSATVTESGNIAPDIRSLEESRREDWLSSHYVHELGANAVLEKRRATLRSTFVPSSQHFGDHECQLPWQPVWEVSNEMAAIDTSNNQGERSPTRQCSSPQRRPMTATGATFSPRPPPQQPENHRVNATASQSANLARLNTRRIRSARAGGVLREYVSPRDGQHAQLAPSSAFSGGGVDKCFVSHIPQAFLRHLPCLGASEGESASSTRTPSDDELEDEAPSRILAVEGIEEEASVTRPTTHCVAATQQGGVIGQESQTIKPIKTTKRRKNKKISREEKRFAERVQELLSISPFGNVVV